VLLHKKHTSFLMGSTAPLRVLDSLLYPSVTSTDVRSWIIASPSLELSFARTP